MAERQDIYDEFQTMDNFDYVESNVAPSNVSSGDDMDLSDLDEDDEDDDVNVKVPKLSLLLSIR